MIGWRGTGSAVVPNSRDQSLRYERRQTGIQFNFSCSQLTTNTIYWQPYPIDWCPDCWVKVITTHTRNNPLANYFGLAPGKISPDHWSKLWRHSTRSSYNERVNIVGQRLNRGLQLSASLLKLGELWCSHLLKKVLEESMAATREYFPSHHSTAWLRWRKVPSYRLNFAVEEC